MTLLRDGFLWRADLGFVVFSKDRFMRKHQLVLQPRATPYGGPTLIAWIEQERTEYVLVFDTPSGHSRHNKPPRAQRTQFKLEATYREVALPDTMSYIAVRALAKNELLGEGAESAMQYIFNACFVNDAAGFDYLCTHASGKTIAEHARTLVSEYAHVLTKGQWVPTGPVQGVQGVIRRAAYTESGGKRAEPETEAQHWLRTLAALKRVETDKDFHDAISALDAMGSPATTDERINNFLAVQIDLPKYRGFR